MAHREPPGGFPAKPLPETLPPQHRESEQAVLGSALMSRTAAEELPGLLDEADFYWEAHRTVYRAILALLKAEEPQIDTLSVGEWLQRQGGLDSIGGHAYISVLWESAPTAAHVDYYAGIVRERSTRRRLLEAVANVAWEAQEAEDVNALCDRAEEAVLAVRERRGDLRAVDPGALVVEGYERYFRPPGPMVGFLSGLESLDKLTRGVKPEQLVVVAGRPGMGKTSFSTAYMLGAARRGTPTVLYSLEMPRAELADRILAAEANLGLTALQEGDCRDNGSEIQRALGRLERLPYWIVDGEGVEMTVAALRADIKRRQREFGVQLVIVDQLSYLDESVKYENENIRLKRVCYALKRTARALKIGLIVPHQLSREVERRSEKRPNLSDLRDSGGVEDACDQAWLLYCARYYEDLRNGGEAEEPNRVDEVEVLVAKNRGGRTGVAKVGFRKWCQQWGDPQWFHRMDDMSPERERWS